MIPGPPSITPSRDGVDIGTYPTRDQQSNISQLVLAMQQESRFLGVQMKAVRDALELIHNQLRAAPRKSDLEAGLVGALESLPDPGGNFDPDGPSVDKAHSDEKTHSDEVHSDEKAHSDADENGTPPPPKPKPKSLLTERELESIADTAAANDRMTESMVGLATGMSQLKQNLEVLRLAGPVLRSLHFDGLSARHDQIAAAHSETFSWVFEENGRDGSLNSGLSRWLRRSGGLFWIRGKAGSGKSTLMKFICDDARTTSLLRIWGGGGGGRDPVIGSYFFWNAGTSAQKSQEGLLRSILFDMIRTCPHLAERVSHFLDDELHLGLGKRWTRPKLLEAYKLVVDTDFSAKFCLFIDGLDEYDGFTDDLLKTVRQLTLHPNVKVCVSSRPWTEFVDAFGCGENRMLKLEDLTESDIDRYVHDTLGSSNKFQRLARHDERVRQLEREVVEKSDGVFLWVHLVVRSLLEGAKYGDNVQLLQQRLHEFPPDLDDFFQHMLDSVPKIYKPKTAKAFRYTQATRVPLEPLVYHFLDCIEEDADFALGQGWRPLGPNDIFIMETLVADRLDGWTKGLLEVVSGPQGRTYVPTVQFLHRTVRDFIHGSPNVRKMFNDQLESTFHPSEKLCHGLLALQRQYLSELEESRVSPLRALPSPQDERSLLLGILDHARTFAGEPKEAPRVYPVLDRAFQGYFRAIVCYPLRYTLSICSLAARFGLEDYVCNKLTNLDETAEIEFGSGGHRQPWPTALLADVLLVYTLVTTRNCGGDDDDEQGWSSGLQYSDISKTLKPSLVQYYVTRGADVNAAIIGKGSIWTGFLGRFREENITRRTAQLAETLGILVDAGADLGVPFFGKPTFKEAVVEIFGADKAQEILGVRYASTALLGEAENDRPISTLPEGQEAQPTQLRKWLGNYVTWLGKPPVGG